MTKTLQDRVDSLENLIVMQRQSLAKGYMHGMLNGLIVAHSVFTDINPTFEDLPKPKHSSKIRHKLKR